MGGRTKSSLFFKSIIIVIVLVLSSSVFAIGFAKSQLRSPPEDLQYGRMWPSASEDDWLYLDLSDTGMAITDYRFSLDKDVINPGVMFYELVTVPSDLPPSPGKVYRYYKIDYDNMVYWDVRESYYIFSIDVEWLGSYDPERVTLFVKDGESWEKQPTSVLELSESAVLYSAKAQGAGYAVIAIEGVISDSSEFTEVNSRNVFVAERGTGDLVVYGVDGLPLHNEGVADSDIKHSLLDNHNLSSNVSVEGGSGDLLKGINAIKNTNDDFSDVKNSLKDLNGVEIEEEAELIDIKNSELPIGLKFVFSVIMVSIIIFLIQKVIYRPNIERKVLERIKKHK